MGQTRTGFSFGPGSSHNSLAGAGPQNDEGINEWRDGEMNHEEKMNEVGLLVCCYFLHNAFKISWSISSFTTSLPPSVSSPTCLLQKGAAFPRSSPSPRPAPPPRGPAPPPEPSGNEWQGSRRAARGADWLTGALTRRRPRVHAGEQSRRGRSRAPGRGAGAGEAGGGRREASGPLKRPPSRPQPPGLAPALSRPPAWPTPTLPGRRVPLDTQAASGAAQAHEGRAPGRRC